MPGDLSAGPRAKTARDAVDTSPTFGQQAILVLALLLAFGLALAFLHHRRHLARLRPLCLPALLLAAFCIPDAVLTLRGTWADAAREADPFVRAFLAWHGWQGLCAAFVVWVLGWALVIDGLETLRARLPERLGPLAASGELYILYAVALGHLDGLVSWTHAPAVVYRASAGLLAAVARDAPRVVSAFPLAYVLYPALVYGALFAAAHALIAVTGRHLALPAVARDIARPSA